MPLGQVLCESADGCIVPLGDQLKNSSDRTADVPQLFFCGKRARGKDRLFVSIRSVGYAFEGDRGSVLNGAHAKLPYVRACLIRCYSSLMLRYESDT